MIKGAFVQVTLKFPAEKERYRLALECINERDRNLYRTQADYVTAAILNFEGADATKSTSLEQIFQAVTELKQKVDDLSYAKKQS